MGWTTDLPDEPGFYWFIDDNMVFPIVVELYQYSPGSDMTILFPGDAGEDENRGLKVYAEFHPGIRWYGPLTPPEAD